ncbi:MAG: ATPase involved in chromosome partitioning [Actinomycetia bacterium]|nr:ATPase involved in chromosome partitioning [Actinomycetes bacterium]
MTIDASGSDPEGAAERASRPQVEGGVAPPPSEAPESTHADLRPFGRRPSPWASRRGNEDATASDAEDAATVTSHPGPATPFGTVRPAVVVPADPEPPTAETADAGPSGPALDVGDGEEVESLEIAIARTAEPGAAGVEINVSEAQVSPVVGPEPAAGPVETPLPEVPEPPVATPPGRPLSRAEQRAGGGGGSEYEEYDLPTIIAIANQKGGVGKTTTSVNLGAGLAELGYRVLVVDLDPQGNATTGLGINARNLQNSIYDVLMHDLPLEDCVEPTSLKNLFVAPATIDLAGAEIELVPAFSRELKLKRALQEARDDYDFALIDCPPSLGLLTVNGLAAADAVIVPIQCEYYALEGLGQLLRNVALVRTNLNPTLDVRGIVLTMYDARTKLSDQVEQEVREHFGPKVYRTVVPRTVRLSEAPSFGQPIIIFDSTSRGAIAYRELSKEVCRGAKRRTG